MTLPPPYPAASPLAASGATVLCSDLPTFTTGTALTLDGGRMAA